MPQLPERRRVSTLAACVAIGLGLIRAGEFLHTRSEPFQYLAPAAPPRVATLNVSEPPRVPPASPSAATASRLDTAPKPAVKRPVRPTRAIRRVTPATPRRVTPVTSVTPSARREPAKRGVLDRLRLGWLRKAFAAKHDR